MPSEDKADALDRFPYSELKQASPRLSRSLLDVFDYFRATMAVQHSALIGQVPALGMQFANDCDWLASQVVKIVSSASTSFTKSEAERLVSNLGALAEKEREKQIVRSLVTRYRIH